MGARLHAWFFRPRQDLDERIVAESNRIFRIGFVLLAMGYGLYVWRGFMLAQVAYVNDLTLGFDTSYYADPFLNTWFLVVFAVVGFMLIHKGIFASERSDDDGLFPVERFLATTFGSAAAVFVLATLMRALAEFQLMGLEKVNWRDDIVIACVFAMEAYVLIVVVYIAGHFFAKRCRKRLEDKLDDE